MKRHSLWMLILAAGLILIGCDRKSTPGTVNSLMGKKPQKKVTALVSPGSNEAFVLGAQIPLEIAYPDTVKIDSIELYVRGKQQPTLTDTETIKVTINDLPGKAGIRLKLFFGGKSETHSRQVELLSNVPPDQYGYRVDQVFDHDPGAYTQGLIFYQGWLYEGTGNYNQSTVRKVRLSDGEVIQARNNASNIFGEGITIFKGRIYQLTYRSQVCFVYDLNTLEEVQKYYFQNKEGWGLTHDTQELIMSDGTHVLYFLDPELFTVKRQLEVYDTEGAVSNLNELEYINGKIWANRFMTDEIVIIDPETGIVEGRIDLTGILPESERSPSTDVLNGIAYDAETDRIFVTGKRWPKLYQISLRPR